MTRKARLWIGATLLLVLAINYAIIGMPLVKRKAYLEKKCGEILVINDADDQYVLDIFRREEAAVEKKIKLVNCIGLSLAAIIASWTIFGLIIGRRKQKIKR